MFGLCWLNGRVCRLSPTSAQEGPSFNVRPAAGIIPTEPAHVGTIFRVSVPGLCLNGALNGPDSPGRGGDEILVGCFAYKLKTESSPNCISAAFSTFDILVTFHFMGILITCRLITLVEIQAS